MKVNRNPDKVTTDIGLFRTYEGRIIQVNPDACGYASWLEYFATTARGMENSNMYKAGPFMSSICALNVFWEAATLFSFIMAWIPSRALEVSQ